MIRWIRWLRWRLRGTFWLLLTFWILNVIVWIEIGSNVRNRCSWPWIILIIITFWKSGGANAAAVLIWMRHRRRGLVPVRFHSIHIVGVAPSVAHVRMRRARHVRSVRSLRWPATAAHGCGRCRRGRHRIAVKGACRLRRTYRRHICCVTVRREWTRARLLCVAVIQHWDRIHRIDLLVVIVFVGILGRIRIGVVRLCVAEVHWRRREEGRRMLWPHFVRVDVRVGVAIARCYGSIGHRRRVMGVWRRCVDPIVHRDCWPLRPHRRHGITGGWSAAGSFARQQRGRRHPIGVCIRVWHWIGGRDHRGRRCVAWECRRQWCWRRSTCKFRTRFEQLFAQQKYKHYAHQSVSRDLRLRHNSLCADTYWSRGRKACRAVFDQRSPKCVRPTTDMSRYRVDLYRMKMTDSALPRPRRALGRCESNWCRMCETFAPVGSSPPSKFEWNNLKRNPSIDSRSVPTRTRDELTIVGSVWIYSDCVHIWQTRENQSRAQ